VKKKRGKTRSSNKPPETADAQHEGTVYSNTKGLGVKDRGCLGRDLRRWGRRQTGAQEREDFEVHPAASFATIEEVRRGKCEQP